MSFFLQFQLKRLLVSPLLRFVLLLYFLKLLLCLLFEIFLAVDVVHWSHVALQHDVEGTDLVDPCGSPEGVDHFEYFLVIQVDAAVLGLVRQKHDVPRQTQLASRNVNHVLNGLCLSGAPHFYTVLLVPHHKR